MIQTKKTLLAIVVGLNTNVNHAHMLPQISAYHVNLTIILILIRFAKNVMKNVKLVMEEIKINVFPVQMDNL
jgi:hypothetical protein